MTVVECFLENFDWKRDFFNKTYQNWNCSSLMNRMINSNKKLRIFENFDPNRDFRKFWPNAKSRFSENFDQNCNFSKILLEGKIFENFDKNRDFQIFFLQKSKFPINWPKLRFSKILAKIDFFQSFDQINSFEKFDKHRDFFFKIPNSKFFREFRTDLRFFIKFKINRDFSSILRKTHNFQQIQDYKKNDKNR